MDLLIVDDDNGFRRFVVRRLKRQGRSVRDANAPSAGIEFARKHSFEVAAIDSMLPEVNGIELLRKPKEIGAACEVAMLRGESSVESSIKHGVFDYVSKPSVRWNGYAYQFTYYIATTGPLKCCSPPNGPSMVPEQDLLGHRVGVVAMASLKTGHLEVIRHQQTPSACDRKAISQSRTARSSKRPVFARIQLAGLGDHLLTSQQHILAVNFVERRLGAWEKCHQTVFLVPRNIDSDKCAKTV